MIDRRSYYDDSQVSFEDCAFRRLEGWFLMSFDEVLGTAHMCAGIFLFFLALGSVILAVLIAVKPGVDHANERFRTRANTFSLVESIVLGFVALTGVVAAWMGPWSFSEFWLWSSLAAAGFYGFALFFVTKPARMAVAQGSSAGKVGMQVNLQVVHSLLLLVVLVAMLFKPV